jgi:uncharacterized cupin superfamily protein
MRLFHGPFDLGVVDRSHGIRGECRRRRHKSTGQKHEAQSIKNHHGHSLGLARFRLRWLLLPGGETMSLQIHRRGRELILIEQKTLDNADLRLQPMQLRLG